MAKKRESKWNSEDLTDWAVFDAIRYLEPDPMSRKREDTVSDLVLWISLLFVLLVGLGLVWLFWF